MRAEVIALLLDEPAAVTTAGSSYSNSHSSAALIRRADGTMAIFPLDNIDDARASAPDTGTYRRARPIIDPDSEEVIGYEMEEVTWR